MPYDPANEAVVFFFCHLICAAAVGVVIGMVLGLTVVVPLIYWFTPDPREGRNPKAKGG